MPDTPINVAFYCYPRKGALKDFNAVARRIVQTAPDVHAYAIRTDFSIAGMTGWARLAGRPTVFVEMDRIKWFKPLRGRRLAHPKISKLQEYAQLTAAGLPLPAWTEIAPDTRLDRDQWGPYVVVKPACGGRGAYVWINKTGRVRYKPPESFPAGHPGRRGPMIAQRFVYTGRWPTSYRVLTWFGRPVVSIRYDGPTDSAPLEGPARFREHGGRSIVASVKGSIISLSAEPDILELAQRTHSTVFPDTPSLGLDFIREHDTGKLYLMECNPTGESWILSNGAGVKMARQFNLDFYGQFNAIDTIAQRTIEVARELAV